MRVKNNREEPIDFLAKAILICYDHLPLTTQFCQSTESCQEYRQAYLILEALSKEALAQVRSEIQEFQFSEIQPYLNYWITLEELCVFE